MGITRKTASDTSVNEAIFYDVWYGPPVTLSSTVIKLKSKRILKNHLNNPSLTVIDVNAHEFKVEFSTISNRLQIFPITIDPPPLC